MTGETCSREDCAKPSYCKGLCTLHYQQMRRGYFGPPVSGLPFEERFWRKVDKEGPVPDYRPDLGSCWVWTGGKTNSGYGKVDLPTRLTHRVAYELLVGPIPEGFQIDHLCRNRMCCNPTHLEPVTPQENSRRSRSVSGLNAAKTECDKGHPLSGSNLRIYGMNTTAPGKRACKQCGVDRSRAYRARQRES